VWALADHLGTIRDIADFDPLSNPGNVSIVNIATSLRSAT
jgi:hypothetical protein